MTAKKKKLPETIQSSRFKHTNLFIKVVNPAISDYTLGEAVHPEHI